MNVASESGRTCDACNIYRHGAQFAPLPNGKRSYVCMFCAEPKRYPLSEPLSHPERLQLKTRWNDARRLV